MIFRRYAELGSVALLKAELERLGVSKRRAGAAGALSGGKRFSRGALYLICRTEIYQSEIVHHGAAFAGRHEAIIDPALWRIVQDKLSANRRERSLAAGVDAPALLAGLIDDADGSRMTFPDNLGLRKKARRISEDCRMDPQTKIKA
jgi:site-specific DNA recombinase